MKEIRKENIVKTTTLSEEEMIEVVGGTRVNGLLMEILVKVYFTGRATFGNKMLLVYSFYFWNN